MGSESSCRIEVDGVAGDGKVLLETDELIVRGAMRLKIPFRDIREVSASDGALHVRWDDHHGRFDVGAQAAKWVEKIRNPKSVIDKIGVKAGQAVSIVGRVEAEFVNLLKKRGGTFPLGCGTRLTSSFSPLLRARISRSSRRCAITSRPPARSG